MLMFHSLCTSAAVATARVFGLICLAVAPSLSAATPKIAAVAQVGNPATPGTRYVFLQLQFLDGAVPHSGYAVYHKQGLPTDPGDFTRLAVLDPTAHAPTLHALLVRADAAGFDNTRLDEDLDGVLAAGPFPSLAQKLSSYLTGDLPGGFDEQQREAMRRVHPQITLAEGRAYLARVPDSTFNTFELREYDPVTEVEGVVVGRVTSPGTPAYLPAPAELSERVETTPRGHLRVHLRWCLPADLREMAFHWNGFQVFRVPRQQWIDSFGGEPPLNLSRADLLNAVNNGHAIPVNRNPVVVSESLPCPIPVGDENFFMTDDNDSVDQAGFAPGGVEFNDGFEATYYVAAMDHFGRIGEPSAGLPVQICDRLPPATPSRVRVDNIYRQDGATDHALRISWQRDDPAEVSRYHLYRFDDPDDAFVERASALWPATPNRIAVIDNVGDGERVSIADLTPGASQLPADDGRTRWFVVVAEDATSCPSPEGFGNLSGASGPVPGALYDLAGPDTPDGRLLVPCCEIPITQQQGTFGDEPLRLTATRLSARIQWVEFRDQLSGDLLGRYHFGGREQLSATPAFSGAGLFQARFGTATGKVSAWLGNQPQQPGPTYPEHRWTGDLVCEPSGGCPGGFIDPVDPETGDLTEVCVTLAGVSEDVRDVALFRRLGDDGPLVLQHRARLDSDGDGVNDVGEICETAPPANPGRACYFIQGYDRNGNPGVVTLVGCVETPGTEGFPTPNITHFIPAEPVAPGAQETDAAIAWFSPRPGVDRFEISITPPPPGALEVFQEGNEAGVGDLWGVVDSPRLAVGFGEESPNFSINLGLESGKNYRARVRAVGPGLFGERETGEWSDEQQITWLQEDPEGGGGGLPPDCPIPWPARAVPALITDPARELEAVLVDWGDFIPDIGWRPTTELWIRVGCFEPGEVVTTSQPDQTSPQPPRVNVRDLASRLQVPLPFTVYLHQTDAESRGTMLQVSHYVDEILTTSPAPGQLDIIDRAFAVYPLSDQDPVPVCLWFRVRHPLIADRSYRAAVVVHGEDREPVEVLRTQIVPAANPIQP